MSDLPYLAGFGNQFQSEAVPGALPVGRNSPQRAPLGLYAELLSGSAFTAPRAENRRTWMYRRQPSVRVGAFEPLPHALWKTGAAEGVSAPPDPLRWHPTDIPAEAAQPLDFIDGLRTIVVNGDADAQTGLAVHLGLANRSMDRALVNADGSDLRLYNLKRDQGETTNLADERKKLAQKMKKQLLAWWQSIDTFERDSKK